MKFNIGDKVVHPQHGVGYVANREEKQFEESDSRTYYVISIPDTTIWVPVDLTSSGLRKLSVRSDLKKCRKVLQSAPGMLKPDRDLQSSLVDHIKQGSIIAQCEVVRDLSAYGWNKPLFGPIADFQRIIFDVLCQEWSIVDELPLAEASHEIGDLLKKGRVAHEY
ncbi:MAG: CarD family transcriptional regulator [Anaerolineae bacterium]|nr:CarD family transcriptional regulator [Anaerolineae bacterium]MDK1080383.1 CarD family transcriptional regulator [Anaerolineae bacterium]MDK1117494.1 CarD family transcriptional regulator [Anaerolineae bacterium]